MAEETAPRTFRLGQTRAPEPKEPGRRAATGTTPKSQRPMASKGDVDKAIALLDTLYDAVATGIDAFGLTETQAKWSEATTKLRRINKDSLSASPKLAKSIANLGEGGGATTFFVMHIIILAGVVPVARRELGTAMSARPARHAAADGTPDAGFDFSSFEEYANNGGGESAEFPGGYNVGERIPGL